MGSPLDDSEDRRLETWAISLSVSLVGFVGSLRRVLDRSSSRVWPLPGPTLMTWRGTVDRMRRTFRLSSSVIFWVLPTGPSTTRTTPGLPTTRQMTSWVLGLMAAGSDSTNQPRPIAWSRTHLAAPGRPSIWV